MPTKKRLACRDCRRVIDIKDTEVCPSCNSPSITDDWSGYVVILHPQQSDVAKIMGINEPGHYALKVR
jgi:DNA-directed RNA polymerase subunit E"